MSRVCVCVKVVLFFATHPLLPTSPPHTDIRHIQSVPCSARVWQQAATRAAIQRIFDLLRVTTWPRTGTGGAGTLV